LQICYIKLVIVLRHWISRDVRTQVQIADRLAIMAEEYLPNDPSVKEMNETVGGYLSEFSVPSYRELLKQEEMRKMMIQQQDTLPKKKTIAVPPAIGGQTP
jgi:hypothetical protein